MWSTNPSIRDSHHAPWESRSRTTGSSRGPLDSLLGHGDQRTLVGRVCVLVDPLAFLCLVDDRVEDVHVGDVHVEEDLVEVEVLGEVVLVGKSPMGSRSHQNMAVVEVAQDPFV